MLTKHDECIHYWSGGAESGRWVTLPVSLANVEAVLNDYRKKGYVAKRGRLFVGAPDTAPNPTDWASVTR